MMLSGTNAPSWAAWHMACHSSFHVRQLKSRASSAVPLLLPLRTCLPGVSPGVSPGICSLETRRQTTPQMKGFRLKFFEYESSQPLSDPRPQTSEFVLRDSSILLPTPHPCRSRVQILLFLYRPFSLLFLSFFLSLSLFLFLLYFLWLFVFLLVFVFCALLLILFDHLGLCETEREINSYLLVKIITFIPIKKKFFASVYIRLDSPIDD